ncbi:hypothetical protein H8A99_03880 [Bradyrhizobium sp. Arg68]|uniref:hypothetical protein n=1 Tax=Bradyrhizobium ivorense TaxID=2511166 RepID=UPI001E535004|nr:hypothetical protein [Bradyrhizobium ivorense]MCC8935656.1 hypothetical protein [Bradyrhizobium ivorense]
MTPQERLDRRATNRAAYAELRAQYDSLPPETRDRLIAYFRDERTRSPEIRWPHYLGATLPLLPREALQGTSSTAEEL